MNKKMTNYFKRYESLVDDWTAFQNTITRPLPTCLWTNTLRTTPDELLKLMAADGIILKALNWSENGFRLPRQLSPGKLWQYLAGLYHVQEEVSMLPVKLLDPQPGERILDLCAAPGGKTAQIAVALNNEGTVIANDRVYQRMRAMGQTIDRLGLLNVSTTTFDGCSYPKAAGLFDRILVDVPCSCEGTSRKNPEVLSQGRPGGRSD